MRRTTEHPLPEILMPIWAALAFGTLTLLPTVNPRVVLLLIPFEVALSVAVWRVALVIRRWGTARRFRRILAVMMRPGGPPGRDGDEAGWRRTSRR